MKTSYKVDVTAILELTRTDLDVLINAIGDSLDWKREHPNNSLIRNDQKMIVEDIHSKLLDLAADITCAV